MTRKVKKEKKLDIEQLIEDALSKSEMKTIG